jgi:aryl-alcohol dehydrogenase-like predicted oxidoreductase
MNTSPLTRRQVLLGGVLGMAGVTSLRNAAHGATAAGNAPAAPAAAAGTITIGHDLRVHRMGFGAMRLTGAGIWGEPKDPAEARRVLHRALDLGVPYPSGLVIATKGGLLRPSAPQWVPDGRPEHLRTACEGSLKRLKLARIDLYQFHGIDPKVPLEDSMGELARLRQEGKIRHIGVSNFNVDELARARRVVPVVSVQNRYNISDRASEDVLDVCNRDALAFIPWAPIARGSAETLEGGTAKDNGVGAALEKAAKAHGVSVLQIAIAWLLAKSPAMLPIPGTSSVAHLEEDIAAARVRLTQAELTELG